MFGISTILFFIDPQVALISALVFGIVYLTISFGARKALQKNSSLIANESEEMVKALQEGLGGIRDVLIDGTQEFYCKIYQRADLSLRKAAGDIVFISGSPRFLMEGIGMCLIAILAYFLMRAGGGVVSAIPLLGALALGAQRLLPVLQQAYAAYSTIKGAESSFEDILDLLRQPLPLTENQDSIRSVKFKEDIVFNDLSFRYDNHSSMVLKNVNLTFKKGEKVGFVGVTGSGKSTLIDILMGLLSPSSGELLIDGVSITSENRRVWQRLIAHVPQNIYLADSSIQENIAFGIHSDQINEDQVKKAAEQAQIGELVKQLTERYDGHVGERGVQLSGGQRQRIGIARALYKDSDVLIFDEATSALDIQTEKKIMQQITALSGDRTIFIVAHRLTTLKECDRIIRINEDFTVDEVNYDELEIK
jgi:ATP-binding cassette subfamily B protein